MAWPSVSDDHPLDCGACKSTGSEGEEGLTNSVPFAIGAEPHCPLHAVVLGDRMRILGPLLAILGVLVALSAMAEPPANHTSAGQIAAEFLAAFNGGDRPAYEGYLRDHWPGFKDAVDYAELRAQSGGFDVVSRTPGSDTAQQEVVKARLADDFQTFEVEVGPGPGHPIQRLSFTSADRPASIPAPTRVPPAQIGRLVDAELAAMGDFSGAVLVAREGRPIYSRAEGFADRAHGVRNTAQTRFRIASMGKMFTAVAILQLSQARKLDLDATVGSILTEYPNAEFGRGVTVRQLLTHTGGAGDFMSKLWADNYLRLNTPADYIALFGGRSPAFKPGSRFDYANYGFIVLGRMVEVVSGESYEDYLRAHIFEPAGMFSSGLNAPPIEASQLATSYVKTVDGYGPPPPPFQGAATPAGGAYTTVGDLLAFANALDGWRLLDRKHTQLLLAPKVKGDDGEYAFGFEVRDTNGVNDVGHDGGGPGENGGLRILNKGEVTVIALSNVAPTWRANWLCEYIAARIRVQ